MRSDPLLRSTPQQEGVDSGAIERFVRVLDGIDAVHSVMLLRHGRVVAEGWWHPYAPELPHSMFSVSKSFTSTAIGFAVHEELLDLDDLVVDLLADQLPEQTDPRLRRVTVRHLLTMTSGHGQESLGAAARTAGTPWVPHVLAEPLPHEPGEVFVYDTGSTFLLSAIIHQLTGGRVLDYLRPRLLEPLGIDHASWERSAEGVDVGGSGLSVTTEDLAAFGQFLLQRGTWNDRQLLPAEWIDEATSFHVSTDRPAEAADWRQGYGFQFWRCRNGAYRGDGAFGQFVVVMPEQDAVLAVTGGLSDMSQVMDAVWGELLPGFAAEAEGEPAAAEAEAELQLEARLRTLSLPTQAGLETSPVSDQLEGIRFELLEKLPGVNALTVRREPGGWWLRVEADTGDEVIHAGYGHWIAGETTIMYGIPLAISSSAAWTGSGFVLRMVFVRTPFTITVAFESNWDGFEADVRQNVAFDDGTFLGRMRGRPASGPDAPRS